MCRCVGVRVRVGEEKCELGKFVSVGVVFVDC